MRQHAGQNAGQGGTRVGPRRSLQTTTEYVNGPWCLTFEFKAFEFKDGDALRVDLEQYH
ncbi:MAG: hypothetical protein ACYDHY_05495 [Acidiferrobacterales bacterium]